MSEEILKRLPNFLINWLGKLNTFKIKPTGYVWKMQERHSWGNSISFLDFQKRTIVGHYSNRGLFGAKKLELEVGDEI